MTAMPKMRSIGWGAIVKNDGRLLRNLKKLEARVAKTLLRKSMRVAAKKLLPLIRKESPVDKGKMRKGIRVRASKFKQRDEIAIVIRTGTPKEMKLNHSFNYPWVIIKGRKPDARGKGAMAPNPFMQQTLERNKDNVRKWVAKDLRVQIAKLVN